MSHASRIADADARREVEADLEHARAEADTTHQAWQTAQRRYKYAPVGTKSERLQKLLAANEAAIKADGYLKRLLRELGRG
ncbi:hypothetical protein ABI_08810 [Asticcacaulis biprosthecium C19]|uniref:Uncharacterized protein n=1 Tax=Asticcacaulis biprosthecium C19 TaxID=715226 RepID=F4QGB7_9CAUL|nr:hypothetical protein [Asticcacaulis biprosthecium]EGF92445.1 hypothetical protein ABI_08810 [Asticcacaulis biprosthecium C19]